MKDTARLRRRILSHEASIAVLGQGYVGLNVASAAAQAGFTTVGIDVSGVRIDDLDRGVLSVPGVPEEYFRNALATGRLTFSTGSDPIDRSEIVLICVPTPLRDHTPDLTYVEDACREVAAHLSSARLVILESTTYPGTTDQLVKPILETSGRLAGRDFLLAYSPERIDPGQRGVRLLAHTQDRRGSHARSHRRRNAVLRATR